MARLFWDNWYRSDGCRTWMARVTPFAGVDFPSLFYSAMRLLFYDENGVPGLLYTGAIFPRAQDVVTWNGNRKNGFNDAALQALLRDGNFKYTEPIRIPRPNGGSTTIRIPLRIEGPDQEDIDKKYYASAPVPGWKINFNFYFVRETADLLGWPQNATGVDYLRWLTAATVLHEITHNHGYDHPETVDYAAGSDYASTLSFVAEQAVCRASPHWAYFNSLYTTGAWLTGPQRRTCRVIHSEEALWLDTESRKDKYFQDGSPGAEPEKRDPSV